MAWSPECGLLIKQAVIGKLKIPSPSDYILIIVIHLYSFPFIVSQNPVAVVLGHSYYLLAQSEKGYWNLHDIRSIIILLHTKNDSCKTKMFPEKKVDPIWTWRKQLTWQRTTHQFEYYMENTLGERMLNYTYTECSNQICFKMLLCYLGSPICIRHRCNLGQIIRDRIQVEVRLHWFHLNTRLFYCLPFLWRFF